MPGSSVLFDKTKVVVLSYTEPSTALLDSYSELLKGLTSSTTTKISTITKQSSLATHLTNQEPPRAILTFDSSVLNVRDNGSSMNSLIAYVKSGGVLVLGAGIANDLHAGLFNQAMKEWGTGWTLGTHAPTTEYKLNEKNPLAFKLDRIRSPILPSFTQKSLNLKVKLEDALYIAEGQVDECSIALTSVGAGYLAYVGSEGKSMNEEGIKAVTAAFLQMNM